MIRLVEPEDDMNNSFGPEDEEELPDPDYSDGPEDSSSWYGEDSDDEDEESWN